MRSDKEWTRFYDGTENDQAKTKSAESEYSIPLSAQFSPSFQQFQCESGFALALLFMVTLGLPILCRVSYFVMHKVVFLNLISLGMIMVSLEQQIIRRLAKRSTKGRKTSPIRKLCARCWYRTSLCSSSILLNHTRSLRWECSHCISKELESLDILLQRSH
jgi:hypothetical protein